MNPRNKPASAEQPEQWGEVARVAAGILDGSIGVTEGSRRLAKIRFHLNTENDPDFLPFAGIDSETDQYPVGEWLSLWNKEALARYDAERRDAEEHYRDLAANACRRLLQRCASAG